MTKVELSRRLLLQKAVVTVSSITFSELSRRARQRKPRVHNKLSAIRVNRMPVTAAAPAFNSSPLQHVGSSAVASVRRAGARVIFRALSLHCARCGEGRLTLP